MELFHDMDCSKRQPRTAHFNVGSITLILLKCYYILPLLCFHAGDSCVQRHYVFKLSDRPPHPCEHDIWETPWGKLSKFGTNIHLAIFNRRKWNLKKKEEVRLKAHAQWEQPSCWQTMHVFSPYFRWGVVSGVVSLSHLITSSVKRSSAAVMARKENPCVLLMFLWHIQAPWQTERDQACFQSTPLDLPTCIFQSTSEFLLCCWENSCF